MGRYPHGSAWRGSLRTADRSRALARAWRWGLLVPVLALLAACGAIRPAAEGAEPDPTVAALVETAEVALAGADYDTAVASYQEAYAKTPWNSRLGHALAAAYAARAQHVLSESRGKRALAAAEADLRAALELLRHDPTLQHSLAQVLVEQAVLEMDPVRAGALREEARGYAAEVVEQAPVNSVHLERRVDLAYGLIERGQLDAAIDELERIHARYPTHTGATVLLAQVQLRKGTELAELGDYDAAGARFSRAVELYASLEHCREGACERRDLELAHRNRITLWLNAKRRDEARQALADAHVAGLQFPELGRELGEE